MHMKAHIVRIGNSRGIRLPKTLLQKAKLEDEVELQAEPGLSSFPKWPNRVPVGQKLLDVCGNGAKIASSTRRRQLGLTRKGGSKDKMEAV
jgi:hypothetical protein